MHEFANDFFFIFTNSRMKKKIPAFMDAAGGPYLPIHFGLPGSISILCFPRFRLLSSIFDTIIRFPSSKFLIQSFAFIFLPNIILLLVESVSLFKC